MNNQRRKEIAAVLNDLADLRSRIETIQSDERDAYDNLPDGIKDSERGQKAEEACSRLEDALTAFDDLTNIYDTTGFEFTDEPDRAIACGVEYPELIEHEVEATAFALLISLQDVTAELSQLHSHHHPACEGGCPTVEYIMNARKVIAKAKGA